VKKSAQIFLSVFFLIAGALFVLINQLERVSEIALKVGVITACAAVVLGFYTWWKIPARYNKNFEGFSRRLFCIYWYVSLSMAMAMGYIAGWWCGGKDSPDWGIPNCNGSHICGSSSKNYHAAEVG